MKKKLLTLFCCLLLVGCVTNTVKLKPEFAELTGWVDMAEPLPRPVQVSVSILTEIDGKLLPLVKSYYQVSNLPLKYDFRQLPPGTNNKALFMRVELRWVGDEAVQARSQMRINSATPEKIMLASLPCFPDCQLATSKKPKQILN